jgi:multidrug efflux pump subunit AcrA (membrane-fusion protein)
MAALDLAPRLLPMVAVTGLTTAWALSPAVAVKVEGSAVLLEPDSRVGVYARSAGQVQRLRQKVGGSVRQGEVLLLLDRVDQSAAGPGAIGPNPDALVRQGEAIQRQQEAIRSQIASLSTSNQPVGLQLKALESLRRDEVIPRYSPLWVGAQDLYLRNQSQIKALEGQLAQLDAAKAQLEGQENSLAVLAPRSGTLLSLSVTPGQAVLPGQRIGTIGPGSEQRSQPRTAIALFSDADAARLRPRATIELDPLLQSRNRYGGSAERWGLLEGRILRLSPASADLAEVSRVVGDPELAANLIARSRQAAVGEGGDPLDTVTDKTSAPVVLAVLELESGNTPSGLRWTGGSGPDLPLENGTPAKAKVEVERRSALSFVLPFLRWLGGAER